MEVLGAELVSLELVQLADIYGSVDSSARRREPLELRDAPDEGHLPALEERVHLTASLRALGAPACGLALACRLAATLASPRLASTSWRLQLVRLHYDFNSST